MIDYIEYKDLPINSGFETTAGPFYSVGNANRAARQVNLNATVLHVPATARTREHWLVGMRK